MISAMLSKNIIKNKMSKIKKMFFFGVIVLAVLFSSKNVFAETTGSGWNISALSNFGLPDQSITDIATNILNWILGLLGIAGVIGFAISGIMYMLSSGNEDMAGKARKAMTASILGVIVGLSGLVVISAIDAALNGIALF